jgi:hypothetical protein
MNWLACHLHYIAYIHNITYNTGASLSARTVRMEPRDRHGDRMPGAFGAGKFGRTIHSGGH